VRIAILTLVLFATISAGAQDETSGQIVTITAAVSAGGFNCHGDAYHCYGVPYTSNSNPQMQGLFWSDFFAQHGFIISLGGSWDLGQVVIDSTKEADDSSGHLTGLSFTFHGTTTDDNGTYQGTGNFIFISAPYRCRYGICYNYFMQQGSGFQVTYK